MKEDGTGEGSSRIQGSGSEGKQAIADQKEKVEEKEREKKEKAAASRAEMMHSCYGGNARTAARTAQGATETVQEGHQNRAAEVERSSPTPTVPLGGSSMADVFGRISAMITAPIARASAAASGEMADALATEEREGEEETESQVLREGLQRQPARPIWSDTGLAARLGRELGGCE